MMTARKTIDIRGSHVRVAECGTTHPEVDRNYSGLLYDADPKCHHEVVALWSGVRCHKCGGWYCA